MSKRKKADEWVGFYSITQLDYPELTDTLSENDYSVPVVPQWSHGGGGYGTYNRLIVGGEGNGSGHVHNKSDYEIGYGGGIGFYSIGWLFRIGRWLRFYPLIGLGGLGAGANVRADSDETAQLMPSTDEKSSVLQIVTVNPGVSIGVGVELRLLGILFGIRAGYMFLPLSEEGKPYIRFTVGIGKTK